VKRRPGRKDEQEKFRAYSGVQAVQTPQAPALRETAKMIQRDLPINPSEPAWHAKRRCKSAACQWRNKHRVEAIVHFVGRDDDCRARFTHL
jgi:hypothetical protein